MLKPPVPLGNWPAGFEPVSTKWWPSTEPNKHVLTVEVLAPGGQHVYSHLILEDASMVLLEEFWQGLIEQVQKYPRQKRSVVQTKTTAISDRPPPTHGASNVVQEAKIIEGEFTVIDPRDPEVVAVARAAAALGAE